jgi:hypothetical protein
LATASTTVMGLARRARLMIAHAIDSHALAS